MSLRFSSALLISLLVLCPARARAEPLLDTVELDGGGLVRGTLAENVPGDHVTIVLPDGQVRVLPWATVERVVPAVAPLLVTPAPAAHARFEGPTAMVHIDAPQTVVLDRKPRGGEAWVLACESPCDRDLPLASDYRVMYGTEAGATRGDTFRLSASRLKAIRCR